jgi:hypothetical protein
MDKNKQSMPSSSDQGNNPQDAGQQGSQEQESEYTASDMEQNPQGASETGQQEKGGIAGAQESDFSEEYETDLEEDEGINDLP